jgi:mercuric reductase
LGLTLAERGIDPSADGEIIIDEIMRASQRGVHAIVTRRGRFGFIAAYGARLAAINASEGDTQTYDDTATPSGRGDSA